MPAHTAFVQLAEPIRCTRSTNSKSAISILAKVLSRSTPALLTRMSTWPHNLSARATIAETSSKSATSARRRFRGRLVRAALRLQHRAVRLRHEAPKPQSDCARLGLREYAARNQPIAIRRTPKAVERRPNDFIVIDKGRLEACLVARFLKGAEVGAAMPVDGGIMVANHRHEVIGVAKHVLDRRGRERVRRLPVVPLKGVELPLDNGARAGGGQIIREGGPGPQGHRDCRRSDHSRHWPHDRASSVHPLYARCRGMVSLGQRDLPHPST